MVLVVAAACSQPQPVALRVRATPVPTPTPAVTPAVTSAPATARTPSRAPARSRSAIDPENRPTPIAGRSNGLLTDADLLKVEGECRAARAAATSLWRLLSVARAQGVSLTPGDCYRPRADQVTVRSGSCAKGNCACAGKPGGSMHGWGKAVDLHDATGAISSFDSPEYLWLKANAGAFGWNHARWAEPPTSKCPEAWHWEWVGDGGTLGRDPIRADVVAVLPSGAVVDGRGGVTAAHDPDLSLRSVVVSATTTPVGGALLVTVDGTVIAVGGAAPCGASGTTDAVAVGAARSGCWVAEASGRVVASGGAQALGSASQRIASMASTSSGDGYWLVAPRGDVHAFGDARSFGSASQPSSAHVVAIAPTASGNGYWLVASDGTVLAFGDAAPVGRAPLTAPAVGIAASGRGVVVVGADGAAVRLGV